MVRSTLRFSPSTWLWVNWSVVVSGWLEGGEYTRGVRLLLWRVRCREWVLSPCSGNGGGWSEEVGARCAERCEVWV